MKLSFNRATSDRAARIMSGAIAFIMALGFASVASADQPYPWQVTLQNAVTPIMEEIIWLNNFTLVIITVITLFVLGLLVAIVVKFNSKANPVASKTTHNTTIEIVWTVVPIIILAVIVAPSIRLLYAQQVIPDADVTIKATGYQWNWGYEYPDLNIGEYVSVMLLNDDERRAQSTARNQDLDQYPRLLAVDNELVVPVGKIVRIDVTGGDVLHALAIPAFGIKVDAVPGRLNSTWFKAEKEGMYYGQCSQICGAGSDLAGHSFMPIAIRVVSDETFQKWAAAASEKIDDSWNVLAAANADDKVKLARQ